VASEVVMKLIAAPVHVYRKLGFQQVSESYRYAQTGLPLRNVLGPMITFQDLIGVCSRPHS